MINFVVDEIISQKKPKILKRNVEINSVKTQPIKKEINEPTKKKDKLNGNK